MKTRMLFSVIEVTEASGESRCQVDWHPELYAILDEISPNAEITDRLIDIAEEILQSLNADEISEEIS